MKTETRFYPMRGLEVRTKDGDGTGNTAVGYAAVFNSDSLDLGGFIERILPGAFTRSLAAANNGDLNVFWLWSHDTAQPLGSTGSGRLKLSQDERGLSFELDTGRMTPAQKSALAEGDCQCSFGFAVRDQEWKELDDGSVERTLIDVDLFECSFVISPAYPETEAALRSLEAWKAEKREVVEPVEEAVAEVTEEVAVQLDTSALKKRALEAILKAKGRAI